MAGSRVRAAAAYLFPGRGLLLQLFLILFLPLTALLLLTTFGSLSAHQQAMRSLVAQRDERATRAAAAAVSDGLKNRSNEVRGLAARISSSPSDKPEDILATSSYLDSDFDQGLAILARNGSLLASSGQPDAWQAFTTRPDVQNWLASAPAGAARLFWSKIDGKWAAFFAVIPASGEQAAAGAASLSALAGSSLSNAFPPSSSASVLIIDSDRNVLYKSGALASDDIQPDHPGIAEALVGQWGTTYVQVGKDEHVVAYSPIDMPVEDSTGSGTRGWALLIEESWEEVESPMLRNTQIAPLVLVPLLLIALAGLWFGVQQVVRPLQRLENTAARLAWGEYEAADHPVGGIAEIQHLQKELAHLAHKVQAAQQSLHSYIGAITAGQEEERRRLARELHDDTLQSLIALKQRVQLAQLNLPEGSSSRSLAELETLTEQSIDNLRRMTRALRPIYLEDLGLAPAVEMLVNEMERAAQCVITFERLGTERRLDPAVELVFYRIAQEALSNVSRHSGASKASVKIVYEPDKVRLSVEDNGSGFNMPKSPAEFAPGGHYGLLGMYERADLIGARLEIQSAPGAGTKLTLTAPGARS